MESGQQQGHITSGLMLCPDESGDIHTAGHEV